MPNRYVIDFQGLDVMEAEAFPMPFKRLQQTVLVDRKKAATTEEKRNSASLAKNSKSKVNKHHANFLRSWWKMSYAREDLIEKISGLTRYIACARTGKRPIFVFLDSDVRPNDALQVFTYDDDYSFGILQSDVHWEWFVNRCSTLTERFRYTSNTVWDSFPWPQSPSLQAVKKVASAAVALRAKRSELATKHNKSLRDLYRMLDLPGANPLREAQNALNVAVRQAFGMTPKADPLEFILELNDKVASQEKNGEVVQEPGLPKCVKDRTKFVTLDAIGSSGKPAP